jgi:hypothetical protein
MARGRQRFIASRLLRTRLMLGEIKKPRPYRSGAYWLRDLAAFVLSLLHSDGHSQRTSILGHDAKRSIVNPVRYIHIYRKGQVG